MKTEDLKSKGLTEEQIAYVLAENGKDIKKFQTENANLTEERDQLKQRAETAEETLKKFDGLDPENAKKELETWKQKAKDLEKDYADKIAQRDFDDSVKEAITAAKGKNAKAIRALLDTETLMKSKNQKADIEKAIADLKAAEDSSFLFTDEQQQSLEQNRARFTKPLNTGGGTKLTKNEIMDIKDPGERQRAIADNHELFGI